MPDEPGQGDADAGQRELVTRLRAVVGARDAENAALRAELEAERELRRRLELRLEELERRLRQDSSDSGTPTSKEGIGARERRRAERADPDRGRRKDRKPGGQPGHQGKGLARDPDPGERREAPPPAECRRCMASLDGAEVVAGSWAQVIDVLFTTVTTEWALPGRKCPCCGEVTIAAAPPGAHAGSVAYGPALNAAAIVLTAHANVPAEKAAQVISMLLGVQVSAGWVDKAASRLARQLGRAGFEGAMEAALAVEDALAADETPVSVLGKGAPAAAAGQDEDEADPGEDGNAPAGAPHVLAVRTLDERLVWLRALASRRKGHVTGGIPARFRGVLITDGYRAYQGRRGIRVALLHQFHGMFGIREAMSTSLIPLRAQVLGTNRVKRRPKCRTCALSARKCPNGEMTPRRRAPSAVAAQSRPAHRSPGHHRTRHAPGPERAYRSGN